MSDNTKTLPEIIVCSACKNTVTDEIVLGIRHWDQFMWAAVPEHRANEWVRTNHIQGFLTSTGRFVDRVEARAIASKQGQIRRELPDKFATTNLDSSHLF